jgi:plastocyanin
MARIRFVVSMMLVLLVLAACGESATDTPAQGDTAPPMTGGEEVEIVMQNTTFQPAEITIQAGTRVTWSNDDPFPHTVTSGTRGDPTDLFDSGNLGGGQSFSYTFEEAGTYEYFCGIHPGMAGTVIVQ